MANERSEVFLRDIFAQLEVAAIAGLSDGNLLRRFVGKDKQLADPAFNTLVGRHGAMVLRACRSILRDEHAAEDAFQATFLILARRAESLWVQGSLAPWLHRVAGRVANRARAVASRQGWHERRVAEQRVEPCSVPVPNDLGTVIHAEVDRLPDRYRGPVILCDLEGHTHEDAALALGCPVGTVKSRLTRARARLRSRLERRGVTPAAGGIALLIGCERKAHLTSKIATDLPQAASRFAARQPVDPGTISASVVKLAEVTVNSMFWNKIAMQLALCFAALTTVGVFGLSAERHQPEPPAKTVTPPALEKPIDNPGPSVDAAGAPLPKEAIARLGSTHLKHGAGSISNMLFTPNSTTLISQSDGETYAWESRTGRLLRQFPKNLGTANSHGMSLSPDGKLLAVPGNSGMRLWDVETAKEVQSIGTQRFLWMCFSPDGKLIATQGGSQFVECNIWDATNGNNIRSWTVPAGSDFATAPLFSKDGKTLITGHADNTVRFWDVPTGEALHKLELDWKSPRMLVISPDGKTVAATAYNSRSIHLIDVADAKERSKISSPDQSDAYGRKERFTEIAFTPDGKSLVAAGIGDGLIFLDPATGKEQRRLEKKFKNVFSLAISPDGKTIASAINGKTIRLIDLATGRDLVEASGHEYGIWSATFADGGKLVASVGGGKQIHLWDALTGREIRRLEGHTGDVSSVSLSADGTQLVSNGADKITRYWDPSTGKEIRRAAGHGNGWNQTRSPDGKIVVTIEANPKTKASSLRLLEAETGKQLGSQDRDHPWSGSAFTRDGKTLVAWSADQIVYLLDPKTGEVRKQYPIDAGGGKNLYLAYSVQLSNDGKLLACGSQRSTLVIVETATGKTLHSLKGLLDGVSAIAFSPDDKMLAWGGWNDPRIHLVELATGKLRHTFSGTKGRVLTLSFSPDGKRLLSGSEDTTATLWDLTGGLREKATMPTAAELDAHWKTLAEVDAAKAYRAMQALAGSPKEALPHLRQRVEIVPRVPEKELARWIADFDSKDFKTRERASKELDKLGEAALGACAVALAAKPSPEARERLELLLKKQDLWRTPPPEKLRIIRALEVLELLGMEAREVLAAIAQGAPGAFVTEQANSALQRSRAR